MAEWQPIDTAPKDGTVVDLWVRDEVTGDSYREPRCSWTYLIDGWWTHRGIHSLVMLKLTPLYWMPEPDPPLGFRVHGLVYPNTPTTGNGDEP